MEETRAFHDEVAATERWFASPRFRETARPYTAQVSSSSSCSRPNQMLVDIYVGCARDGTAAFPARPFGMDQCVMCIGDGAGWRWCARVWSGL
jgi:hypothetical protein